MKTRIGMSIGLALTLVVGVFATMLALGLFTSTEVRAQSTVSVTRSFAATVAPDGTLTVTITPVDVAPGSITETLPAGFTYVDSTIGDSGTASAAGQEVTFVLIRDRAFTYTVTAPMTVGGPHPFSGTFRDSDRMDGEVLGTPSVTVAVPPEGPTAVRNVKVAHTPTDTGGNARITVSFNTSIGLMANLDTITIEFEDDVQVPDLLDERFISVVGPLGNNTTVASPLDVTVERFGTPADETRVDSDPGRP